MPALKIMIDSGAFSAWAHGGSVDLKSYMSFLRDAAPLIHCYVTLDTIPKLQATSTDVETSALTSYRNHQIMKDAGLKPIPVFHMGEAFHWLDRYVRDGDPVIGISPPGKINGRRAIAWLDRVFSRITDSEGRPHVRTHGFGVTQPPVLLRYPWHTADSTTWTIMAGYGTIFVPQYVAGKPDYSRKHILVAVSGEHAANSGPRVQYEAAGETLRQHVDKFLAEEVGCHIGHVRYSNYWRRKACIAYYHGLERAAHGVRFKYHRSEFEMPTGKLPGRAVTPHLELVFAALTDMTKNAVLSECNANFRLLSYYLIKDYPLDKLEYLVKHGVPKQREQKRTLSGTALVNARALAVIERAAYKETTDATE